MRVEHLPPARPVAHGLVQPAEQSTVAAPHVDDVLRLRCIVVPVEASNDQIAQRGEVLLMLESAADDVDRPIDVRFVTRRIACEGARGVPEQELLRVSEHRPVGRHSRGDEDSVDDKTADAVHVQHIAGSSRPPSRHEQAFDPAANGRMLSRPCARSDRSSGMMSRPSR